MSPSGQPSEARVRHADAALVKAVAEGFLTLDEYDARCKEMWHARTEVELQLIIADLPLSSEIADVGWTARRQSSFCFFGTHEVTRYLRSEAQASFIVLFGRAHIIVRLRDRDTSARLRVVTLFSSTSVSSDSETRVESRGASIFGSRRELPSEPSRHRNLLRLEAVTVFGEIVVR